MRRLYLVSPIWNCEGDEKGGNSTSCRVSFLGLPCDATVSVSYDGLLHSRSW